MNRLIFVLLIIHCSSCNNSLILNQSELVGWYNLNKVDSSTKDITFEIIKSHETVWNNDTTIVFFLFKLNNNTPNDLVIEFPFNHHKKFKGNIDSYEIISLNDSIRFSFADINDNYGIVPMYVKINSYHSYQYKVKIKLLKEFSDRAYLLKFYYYQNINPKRHNLKTINRKKRLFTEKFILPLK